MYSLLRSFVLMNQTHPWLLTITQEIYNSQSEEYGGWSTSGNGGESPPPLLPSEDGRINIRLPKYSVLVFEERL